MPDSILVFTFSPVQKFIVEARRTADLYAGSQFSCDWRVPPRWLSRNGKVRSYIPQTWKLMCQTDWWHACRPAESERLPRAPMRHPAPAWRYVKNGNASRLQLGRNWRADHRIRMRPGMPSGAGRSTVMEIYWACASLEGRSYAQAYDLASRSVDAAKRPRAFLPSEEEGLKDTLSGRRQALRTKDPECKSLLARAGEGLRRIPATPTWQRTTRCHRRSQTLWLAGSEEISLYKQHSQS